MATKSPYRSSPEVIEVEKQVVIEKIKSRKIFEEIKSMLQTILNFCSSHIEATVIMFIVFLGFILTTLAIVENYHGRSERKDPCQETIVLRPDTTNGKLSCDNNQTLTYDKDILYCHCR